MNARNFVDLLIENEPRECPLNFVDLLIENEPRECPLNFVDLLIENEPRIAAAILLEFINGVIS